VHWFSILNSFTIVIFLSGIIGMIPPPLLPPVQSGHVSSIPPY